MKIIKPKTGRPTKYKKEFAAQAFKLCKLGAIDLDLADFFNVDKATINRWKKTHKDFCASLKDGKAYTDSRVEFSLYQRAVGFSHPEEKIFNFQGEVIRVPTTKHYPPDTTACIFWLKNRKPTQWRDKVEQDASGEMIINVRRM